MRKIVALIKYVEEREDGANCKREPVLWPVVCMNEGPCGRVAG